MQDVPYGNPNGWRDFWYDALGRMTSTATYSFGSYSSPIDADDPSMGFQTLYSGAYLPNLDTCRHDPLGRRVRACAGRWMLYDGDQVTYVFSGAAAGTRFVHGASLDEPLVAWDSTAGVLQLHYFVTDGAGRLLSYTDSLGHDARMTMGWTYNEASVHAGAIANAEGFGASAGVAPSHSVSAITQLVLAQTVDRIVVFPGLRSSSTRFPDRSYV